jgi:hypothetical protein
MGLSRPRLTLSRGSAPFAGRFVSFPPRPRCPAGSPRPALLAVTLVAIVVGAGLVLSELSLYLTPAMESTVSIDQSEGKEHMTITLDISFWHLPCESAELEVQDAKGRLYSASRVHVHKRDLPLGAEPHRPGGLGMFESAPANVGKRGCRLSGDMDVRRVAGNFHVVPHAFSARGGLSMFRGMAIDDLLHWNASHTIHHLRFGSGFQSQEHPLDGVTSSSTKPAQFQFFIQVVPTRYMYSSVFSTDANQISVTQHTAPSDPSSPYMVPPGVVFRYDISPIMVSLSSASPGLARFLTGVCAVVGGVFAVTSMLDKLIHGTISAVAKVD